jgi:hypothetical protein
MPKKIRRADLFFLKSGPSAPALRRIWRGLPVKVNGTAPWAAPGLLAGRDIRPEILDAEAAVAMEEGSLLPASEIDQLPVDYNLILFKNGEWEEPAAIVEGEMLTEYRAALSYQIPLLFESEALFGPFFWKLTPADELLDEEHLTLEFLDAVDAERRRYERLRNRYESGSEAAKPKRDRIPEEVRVAVWRRDEGRCVGCGSQDRLEFDHVIPVAKGGSNTERNVQLLCERCNRSKADSI